MPDVRIIIDGQEIAVPRNSTILDAAERAGIKIPTLCDHPAIKPIGACRICLVEVEKQRTLQPACTFPVSEGMVVHTRSPQVVEARRFVLQLLFSERNHFCMYCQMSGSCELQRLAYEYGLDHWEYDRAFPKLAVDATRKYFVMDHNRCILCRRCIRACEELVGNHTLGLKNRGANTMVIADADVPFGQSSCVSCGTCLQVCPTGALMDRASAYMGSDKEITRVKSRCMACSLGCGVELVIRENRVIRIDGDWAAEPNHGLLCETGRFIPVNERRHRVRKPLIRGATGWAEASWEEALKQASAQLKAAEGSLLSVVSGFATTEAAQALAQTFPGPKALLGAVPADGETNLLSYLDEADLFVAVGTDLTAEHWVAGFALKRGVRNRGARLIVLDDDTNGLEPWAYAQWPLQESDKAAKILKDAEKPVIIYGQRGADVAKSLAKEVSKAKLMAFAVGGNAKGIAAAGISDPFTGQKARAYYVLAGEMAVIPPTLLEALQKADFVVVQSCFREPWEDVADVILPSPTTYEKDGTMTNTEGRLCQVVAGVKTTLPSEVQVIQQLGALLK